MRQITRTHGSAGYILMALLFVVAALIPVTGYAADVRTSNEISLDWSIDEDSWVMVTADISDVPGEIENIEWTTHTVKSGGRETKLFSDGPDPYVEFRAQDEGETTVTVNVMTADGFCSGEIVITWGAEGADSGCKIGQHAPSRVELVEDEEASYLIRIPIEITRKQPATAKALLDWVEVPEGMHLEITDVGGKPLGLDDRVATAHRFAAVSDKDGSTAQTGLIVVAGDILGTGTINMTQLVRMARVYTGLDELESPFAHAASLSGEGDVSLSDLVIEANAYRESMGA